MQLTKSVAAARTEGLRPPSESAVRIASICTLVYGSPPAVQKVLLKSSVSNGLPGPMYRSQSSQLMDGMVSGPLSKKLFEEAATLYAQPSWTRRCAAHGGSHAQVARVEEQPASCVAGAARDLCRQSPGWCRAS